MANKLKRPVTKRSEVRSSKQGKVKNYRERVAAYKQFLKEQGDHDWAFILETLAFKIERTRAHILKHNIIQDARKIAKEMKVVADLLKKVANYDYDQEFCEPIERKYGKLVLTRAGKDVDKTSFGFKYAKETSNNRKQIWRESSQARRRAYRQQQDDLKHAFNLMHKQIWSWWD